MSLAAAPVTVLRPVALWGVTGAVGLILAILAGVGIGETPLPVAMVAQVFANNLWNAGHVVDPIAAGIIWSYRLPRTLVAAGCGAALALSGVVLQSLVRNALADPYLLGVSAGAGAGAVSVTILGLGGGMIGMSAGAFGGATLAFVLVAALARAAGGGSAQLRSLRPSAVRQCKRRSRPSSCITALPVVLLKFQRWTKIKKKD